MDLNVIAIIVGVLISAWTIGSSALFGWIGPKVSEFFGTKSDNEFLEFGKRVAADFVDELDQRIEQGMSNADKRASAIGSTVGAITAKRSPKKIVKTTGKTPQQLAATLVEASVNRKRAMEKATAARSVEVGPR